MFASNPYRFLFVLLLALPLAMTGCDSSDSNGDGNGNGDNDPPPTPPSFNIASQTVEFPDGSDGIVFFVLPSEDVVLVRVDIRNPRGQTATFNAGSTTIVQGQEFPLQDANEAYIRISGTWSFTFVGRRAAGDQTSFEVTQTVTVGALTDTPSAPSL